MDLASKLVTGLIVCALLPTVASGAQTGGPTVLKTIDLRTYSEDVTYVGTGPHAKHVALIEGTKIMAYPLTSQGKGSVKELFDLAGRTPQDHLNGIAYMDSEKRYAIVTRWTMDRLMVFDSIGRLESERPIQYPAGYVPLWVECIEYIPQDSPASDFPDHLAMCAGQGHEETNEAPADYRGDVLILNRDGTVVKRIALPAPQSQCLAVAYQSPGRLLVTGFNSDWRVVTILDFDGNLLGQAPQLLPDVTEGLVALPDGNVLAAGEGGTVWMLDSNLAPKPTGDRTFRQTQGMPAYTYGLAWNSAKNAFVLSGAIPNISTDMVFNLYELPSTLSGVSKIEDLSPRDGPTWYIARRLTYLPGEDLIAMAHTRIVEPPNWNVPHSIQLFNGSDGSHSGEIDLQATAPVLMSRGGIRGLAYLPAASQFAITFYKAAGADVGLVHLVNRDGAYVRTIDYSATINASIFAVAAFPSGDRLLLDDRTNLYVGDLNGNILSQFSISALGIVPPLMDLTPLASGPWSGAFAAVETSGTPAKLVIFTLGAAGKKK
ncbi:MAG TPA: hypothetical protein PKJ41_02625 [Bryobacteraceae bacterium]|nr:hypothetical protein [Bryobacteraceae bacterium]